MFAVGGVVVARGIVAADGVGGVAALGVVVDCVVVVVVAAPGVEYVPLVVYYHQMYHQCNGQ